VESVSVREEENGMVHIEFQGEPLVARAFPRDARVRQGAIVENKILGETLRLIQQAQVQRDLDRLENTRLTLHEEDALRRAMGEPGLPTRRKDDRRRNSQSVAAALPVVQEHNNPLGDVLAWARQQSSTLPARSERRRKAKPAPPKIAEHSALDERFMRLRDLLA
jgi:hypothetical protein